MNRLKHQMLRKVIYLPEDVESVELILSKIEDILEIVSFLRSESRPESMAPIYSEKVDRIVFGSARTFTDIEMLDLARAALDQVKDVDGYNDITIIKDEIDKITEETRSGYKWKNQK